VSPARAIYTAGGWVAVSGGGTPAPPTNIPPSAPTTLTVTASGQTALVLTWGAATDSDGTVTAYHVRIDGAWVATVTSGLTYTATGLTPGTTYAIAVRASDDLGLTGPDATATGTTGAGTTVVGWLRTATNTGLAAVGVSDSALTPYIGSLTVTGYLYRRTIALGSSQLILGPGAHLEQCKITGTRVGSAQIRFSGAGQRMTNCDFIGNAGSNLGETIGIYHDAPSGIVITSLRQTGFTIMIQIDGGVATDSPSFVDSWYGYDQTPETGFLQHRDGFTRRSGNAPITIRNSRIVCDQEMTTGALFIQPTWGPAGHVTVEDSFLEGKGYCATIESCNNVTIRRNRFRPGSDPNSSYGPVSATGTRTDFVWTDNYLWADTPGNDYKGTVVSA